MGLNDPRGKAVRIFRVPKPNTNYGDVEEDEDLDDNDKFTVWNMYIDDESGQEYYYNTESGETAFKPPKDIKAMLEKEIEEKSLEDTGADLPEELRVYAIEVEADAKEKRMRIFKEEEAQRKKSTPKHGNRMTRGVSKELKELTTLNDVEKEQQRINAVERQTEFKRWMKKRESELRFYDYSERLLPTETRFYEILHKNPAEVTDEELTRMYQYMNERETRWDIEISATIRLQVVWRRHKGTFHTHIRRQAQKYREEHDINVAAEKDAKALLRKKEIEAKEKAEAAKLKRKNMSSADRVARLQTARRKLLEAEQDDSINVEELLREIMGEDEHTSLSAHLSNDLGADGPPKKTIEEKMKQILVLMEGNLAKMCFLGWKNHTRENYYFKRAMHHELDVRFHRWHFEAHRKRRLRTRMRKTAATFYYVNLEWAFHRWYMRTRVNFSLKTLCLNGQMHRVLTMRADLSDRDSDGLLGIRADKVLMPRTDGNFKVDELRPGEDGSNGSG